MKAKSPPHMQVIKREDKQDKLTDFILAQLDQLDREHLLEDPHELQLLALSATSPVIGALKTVASRRDLSKVHLRIIFADIQKTDTLKQLEGFPQFSVSWACNSRLLDAHEQLVICDSACWIGDCMRREPRKRDAFECFADNCQETTTWAKTSFERLWAISIPLVCANDTDHTQTDTLMTLPLHVANMQSATIVGTRH